MSFSPSLLATITLMLLVIGKYSTNKCVFQHLKFIVKLSSSSVKYKYSRQKQQVSDIRDISKYLSVESAELGLIQSQFLKRGDRICVVCDGVYAASQLTEDRTQKEVNTTINDIIDVWCVGLQRDIQAWMQKAQIDTLIWSSRKSREEKKIWNSLVKEAWCDIIGNDVLAREKRVDEKEEHAEERIIAETPMGDITGLG